MSRSPMSRLTSRSSEASHGSQALLPVPHLAIGTTHRRSDWTHQHFTQALCWLLLACSSVLQSVDGSAIWSLETDNASTTHGSQNALEEGTQMQWTLRTTTYGDSRASRPTTISTSGHELVHNENMLIKDASSIFYLNFITTILIPFECPHPSSLYNSIFLYI